MNPQDKQTLGLLVQWVFVFVDEENFIERTGKMRHFMILAAMLVLAVPAMADTFGSGANQFTIDFVTISGATNSGSAGESGGQDGCFNNQCNRGVDNLDIVCHNLYLKVNKQVKMINRPQDYSILRRKMPIEMPKS